VNIAIFRDLILIESNKMPPKRKLPFTDDQLGPNLKVQKTDLVSVLISEFGDLQSIQFEPFQPEEECPVRAILSSDFLA
jgi:hypothetical protein